MEPPNRGTASRPDTPPRCTHLPSDSTSGAPPPQPRTTQSDHRPPRPLTDDHARRAAEHIARGEDRQARAAEHIANADRDAIGECNQCAPAATFATSRPDQSACGLHALTRGLDDLTRAADHWYRAAAYIRQIGLQREDHAHRIHHHAAAANEAAHCWDHYRQVAEHCAAANTESDHLAHVAAYKRTQPPT